MPEIVKATLPLLVSVMFCGSPVVPTNCPGNVKLLAERSAVGAVPVPVSEIVCGLSAALSTRETVPAVASEAPQVWVNPKSPLLAPAREMLVIVRA